MKVAVACASKGEVSAHLGGVSQFLVFDVEDGKVKSREVRTNKPAGRASGGSGEARGHGGGDHHVAVVDALLGVSALICGGLGHRIASALNEGGITVWSAPPGIPAEDAVAALVRAELGKAQPHCCCHEQ